MQISGKICAQVLKKIRENIEVGVSCHHLDQIAKEELQKLGATPSFMTVDNYQWSICTTVNEQVVHGIPTNRILQEGDILGVDVGALYQGFHSDMAITVSVGRISRETERFLEVGTKILKEAIEQAKVGARVGDISATIHEMIEGATYSVVKDLTGHGIGRSLHEDPPVPGFGKRGTGPKILANMTLAIEVIYTQGSGQVSLEDDGWTITSRDGSLAGLFEQTILTAKNGPIVLTPYL